MKKNNKQFIILIIVIVIALLSLVMFKSSNNVFKIEDVFEIEILGTEGYGYADITLNPDFIATSGVNISEFVYDLDKKSKLSNGEIITVTVKDSANIHLDKKQLTFEVSGLKKGTDLDIFKDIIICYDEQTKDIVIDNSKCSEFIKENVLFIIERKKEKYDLGEKVVIIGYVDMNAATDNLYNIIKTEYEYTVE